MDMCVNYNVYKKPYQKIIQLFYLENMTTKLNKYWLPHVVWVNESWPSLSPCSPHRHWRHSDTLKICPDTQSRAYRHEEEGAERVGSGRSPLNSYSGSRLLWKRESLWVNDLIQTVTLIHFFYDKHHVHFWIKIYFNNFCQA